MPNYEKNGQITERERERERRKRRRWFKKYIVFVCFDVVDTVVSRFTCWICAGWIAFYGYAVIYQVCLNATIFRAVFKVDKFLGNISTVKTRRRKKRSASLRTGRFSCSLAWETSVMFARTWIYRLPDCLGFLKRFGLPIPSQSREWYR